MSALAFPVPSAVPQLELGPVCACGRRGTERVGYSERAELNSDTSALIRRCSHCGRTYVYRLFNGRLVPFHPMTSIAFDEMRSLGALLDVVRDERRAS
jgi:hypothetical protein